MQFGSVFCTEAIEIFRAAAAPPIWLLAHRTACGACVLKKGHRLGLNDFHRLINAGVEAIVVARLGSDDIHENEAAARVAAGLAGTGIRFVPMITGRINFHAEAAGVLAINTAAVAALNRVDESITLATLDPYASVVADRLVATIKIIPYAVADRTVRRVEAMIAESMPLLWLHPYRSRRIALITSSTDHSKPALAKKAATIIDARAQACGGNQLSDHHEVAHRVDAMAMALQACLDENYDTILMLGATAIVDRGDIIPAAIMACGGVIEHFGMPVEPGNLLLLGKVGTVRVIGLPGCVRSPTANGFDWVLQRALADLPLGAETIMAMGCGGLLKGMETSAAISRHRPKVSRVEAILLAAGSSRRMPDGNKILMSLNPAADETLLERTIRRLCAARIDRLILVTGADADAVSAAAIAAMPEFGGTLEIVFNPHYADGMGTSLAAAVSAVSAQAAGCLVAVADQPHVTTAHYNRLIAAFDSQRQPLCVSSQEGIRGVPVLFGRLFFSALAKLDDDRGGRAVLDRYADLSYDVAALEDDFFLDLDTPEALQAYRLGSA